jgi:hypothetical protein
MRWMHPQRMAEEHRRPFLRCRNRERNETRGGPLADPIRQALIAAACQRFYQFATLYKGRPDDRAPPALYTDSNVSEAHPRFRCCRVVVVMAGALVYEAFDIHDPKPFLIDPEFLLMMLSSVLIFCIGITALIRGLYSFCLSLAELLPIGTLGVSFRSVLQHDSFEIERLLFSPPLSVTSLRI